MIIYLILTAFISLQEDADDLMKLGIDIGSTTVKLVLMDRNDKIVFSRYERHMSNVFEKVSELMLQLYDTFKDIQTTVSITGSGGPFFIHTSWNSFRAGGNCLQYRRGGADSGYGCCNRTWR